MSNQPTLLERSIESTKKLAWMDDMIRQYATAQCACANLMSSMEQQARMDKEAYATILSMHALSTRKLEILNDHREKLFAIHDAIMNDLLDGKE